MDDRPARRRVATRVVGFSLAAVLVLALVGAIAWFQIRSMGSPVAQPTASLQPRSTSDGTIPTRDTTGVPEGWIPKEEHTGDLRITQNGAVIEDLRLTDGRLYVLANNVTLRRVELVSARIVNYYSRVCYNGLRIEDVTIRRGPVDVGMPAIESGGYAAVRLQADGITEGVRVGEQPNGCGPVVLEDSWLRLEPPDDCSKPTDWHGDGVQGYQGAEVTVRRSYIELVGGKRCPGTAAIFYSDQGNTYATIEDVVVAGGPYPFRLATPGRVSGLKVVADSWLYAPVDVEDCKAVEWGKGNSIVRLAKDGSWKVVEALACENH